MNYNNLRAEIARNNMTIPKLALAIGINKKTLYSKMNGSTDFTQTEISKIQEILSLDGETVLSIFFNSIVS